MRLHALLVAPLFFTAVACIDADDSIAVDDGAALTDNTRAPITTRCSLVPVTGVRSLADWHGAWLDDQDNLVVQVYADGTHEVYQLPSGETHQAFLLQQEFPPYINEHARDGELHWTGPHTAPRDPNCDSFVPAPPSVRAKGQAFMIHHADSSVIEMMAQYYEASALGSFESAVRRLRYVKFHFNASLGPTLSDRMLHQFVIRGHV